MEFILRAMGCYRSPLFSMMCQLCPITFSKGIRVPHFPKISLISVDLYLFLTHLLPVFVPCTPILEVFTLRASLLTPNFRSFYRSDCLWHLSEVTVLLGSGFETELPPKIGSLVKPFSLPLPNLLWSVTSCLFQIIITR